MNKIIVINNANKDIINDIISKAEGRATARTIDYEDCVAMVNRIDKLLNLPQKAKNGIRAHIDLHAQTFSVSYKGTPYSTHIEVLYRNGSWRLIRVFRAETHCYSYRYNVRLTETAKNELMRRRIAECTCFR